MLKRRARQVEAAAAGTDSAGTPRDAAAAAPEAELHHVAERLTAAERELAQARAARERAERERDALGEIDADEFCGWAAPDEADRRRAAVERRLVEARATEERVEGIVRVLQARGAALARQLADEILRSTEGVVREAEADVAAKRAALAAAEAARDAAEAQLARARVATRFPARRFDPNEAREAHQAERQDGELVAQAAQRGDPDSVPPHLREAVQQRIALLARDEAERNERATRALVEAGFMLDPAELV